MDNLLISVNKSIRTRREIEAWKAYKKAVSECLLLDFQEKQLVRYVQIQYVQVEGGIK